MATLLEGVCCGRLRENALTSTNYSVSLYLFLIEYVHSNEHRSKLFLNSDNFVAITIFDDGFASLDEHSIFFREDCITDYGS